MTDYQTIEFEVSHGVATLRLNRPERLNSFNQTMHEEVRDALGRARPSQEARALLITGTGRGFCAGQDLSERHVARDEAMPDLGQTVERGYNPLVRELRALDLPIVCAVNGVAAGAGANLALACDIVLACRSASFIQAFCRIGLIPDSGGTWFLPRLVGPARAAGLAMLGERLSAEDAERWGLIWRCVDDDRLMDEAVALARYLATQPTRALALTKRALNAAGGNDLDTQLDLERDLQREAGRTEDYREGVAAFIEKRTPNFRGH